MTQSDAVINAAQSGDAKRLRELITAEPELVNARNARGQTPILAALYHNHRELADLILEFRPRLDIFEAAATGRLDRVKQLVTRDPSLVDACAPDGFHPLGLACFFGRAATAEFLMDEGADVNAPSANDLQVRPLHSAVAARSPAIVTALLARGADPGAPQQAGLTPLHAAAHHGDQEIVRLLLSYGADPRARDDHGVTPADLARERGHATVALLIEPRSANAR